MALVAPSSSVTRSVAAKHDEVAAVGWAGTVAVTGLAVGVAGTAAAAAVHPPIVATLVTYAVGVCPATA
jgi:hypothetical protein